MSITTDEDKWSLLESCLHDVETSLKRLQSITLAADELAKAGDAALHLIEHMEGRGNSRQSVDLKAALAKFREATK